MSGDNRKDKQRYPKWQAPMEKWQLALNKAATDGDMKAVGKYTLKINQLWDKHHEK